jgi:hypothetical protein
MKPSLMHYFFAQDWPLKIWLVGFSLFCAITAGNACEPSFALLRDWHFLILFISAILVAPTLGFFLALPLAWIVIGPFYHFRAKLNGAPFHVGDHVQILVGSHRGKVARIYSTWQGDTFRVELGSDAEKSYKDIFSPTKVLRSAIANT